MKKIIALLLSVVCFTLVLFILFIITLEQEEGIYACYMDNGDIEFCKEQKKIDTYEQCVPSMMKDILEGDDAVAREWCREQFPI